MKEVILTFPPLLPPKSNALYGVNLERRVRKVEMSANRDGEKIEEERALGINRERDEEESREERIG